MAASDAPLTQPLTIPCGADWTLSVPFTDTATGDPIALQDPKIQVRAGAYSGAQLLATPTATVSGNTVTVLFTGASTALVGAPRGFYDLFATRVDNGEVVKLLQGPVTFTQNVTTPTT